MRILHYMPHQGGVMYEWQLAHMVDELRRGGHLVRYLNPISELGRTASAADYGEIALRTVRSMAATTGCDLFFSMAADWSIQPDVLTEIRRLGIACVLLSCDDYSVPFQNRRNAPAYDLVWTTVRENRHLLEKYGARVVVMPWGANPYVFHPASAAERAAIGFVGQPYGARGVHLRNLMQAGVPVVRFGKPGNPSGPRSLAAHPVIRALRSARASTRHVVESLRYASGRRCLLGSVISAFRPERAPGATRDGAVVYDAAPRFEEMGTAVNSVALSLGSIELGRTYVLRHPLLFIRLREFEVPMCGGVHLVNRSPELMEYFEEGKEMLFYDSPTELIDLARFYLKPEADASRAMIRRQARLRAEAEHTWSHRFTKLAAFLGLERQWNSRQTL